MNLRVALIGAGNMAHAFLEYWQQRDFGIDLRIVSVYRRRGVWHGDETATIDLNALVYRQGIDPFNNADLVIESLPSVYPHGEPATSLLQAALERKIDVLTVDKGPLVAAYHRLNETAAQTGARLRFCVGGALPAVDVALRDLRGATIRSIRAILNGTSNFVLSEMDSRGCSMDEALALAVARGIAEPDPSQDLDGIDTAAKMIILVNAALSRNISLAEVSVRGLRDVELRAQPNFVWKLLGSYENGAIRVAPTAVSAEDVFSRIGGTDKIAEFDTVEMGKLAVMGGASGRIQMGATMTKEILNLYNA